MATIKSYSDLEQSRKLAEILPIESADMFYPTKSKYEGKIIGLLDVPLYIGSDGFVDTEMGEIYAWSLAALFSVLPEIQGGKPVIALDDNYITYPHMSDLYTKSDILVDACVDIIEKLNELKLL